MNMINTIVHFQHVTHVPISTVVESTVESYIYIILYFEYLYVRCTNIFVRRAVRLDTLIS